MTVTGIDVSAEIRVISEIGGSAEVDKNNC